MNRRGHRRKNNNIPQVEGTPAAPILVTPAPSVPVAPAPSAPVASTAPAPSGPVTPVPAATTTAAAAIATALHCPRRQQQLPQRFRQDDTAAHLDDGEWINLNDVSSGEDKDDPPEVIVNAHTHLSPLQTTTSTLLTNPFAMRKRGLKSTSDVQFFFRKDLDTGECICVPCE